MNQYYTKNLFLVLMSSVYLVAFSSFYHQIAGLYGDNGILPVRSFAQIDSRGSDALVKAMTEKPSLVWLGPSIGLDLHYMVHVVALLGIVMSFMAVVFVWLRNVVTFFTLYALYFSLYQVGQTFMSFQWDTLLMEAGFLTIFIAPIFPWSRSSSPSDLISFWSIKWLFFRLMFSSGIVKLTSMCPTWWSLTALDYHFASQCIPTPLAWYAHNLPKWLLKLGVIGTYVAEIGVPFLAFAPVRSMRLLCFWTQIFFQLAIILTGNYNFFNLLTMVLCVSLLTDDDLPKILSRRKKVAKNSTWKGTFGSFFRFSITSLVIAGIAYASAHLFGVQLTEDGTVNSEVKFTVKEFNRTLQQALPITAQLGFLSLGVTVVIAISKSLSGGHSFFTKVKWLLTTILYAVVAGWIFTVSLVPFSYMDASAQKSLVPVVQKMYRDVEQFQIVNSYGLFRHMTGINGRPELIVEGSNKLDAGWKEYSFRYKPGNVADYPPFIVPHQPRLDWQMWFAALSKYQDNPWLVSFVYRLLSGQRDVMRLLDDTKLPFKKAPKYIRVQLYTYEFTNSSDTSGNWWQRTLSGVYMQPVTKESVVPYLKGNLFEIDSKKNILITNKTLKQYVHWVYTKAVLLSPTVFVYSTLTTALCLKALF